MSVNMESSANARQRQIITAGNSSYDDGTNYEDVRLRRTGQHAQANGDPQNDRWPKVGSDNMEYDSTMEELLEQLPSRQLESVAEIAARSLWKKQSLHRGTIRITKDSAFEEEIVRTLQEDMDNDEDFVDNIDGALRTMPTTLSKKRNIKHRVSSRKKKKLSRRKLIKYWFAMAWQHAKYEMRKVTHLFDLWRSHLMTIEGCFGTSVVSYFIFLKWVLLINIPIFLLIFSFLVIPQILYRYYQKEPPGYEDSSKTFTGLEILTGTGFFEDTEMYYGGYTNETVEINDMGKYQMNYAYLFTSGGYYMFCLIILGYSYLRSYRIYYIEASQTRSLYYFNLVFCGWDYGIRSGEASRLKQKSIFNEFKEYLAGHKEGHRVRTRDEVARKWFFRFAIWTVVLALLAASGYATYTVSVELSIKPALVNSTESLPVISTLSMPVVISTIQLFVPMIFTFLEAHEEYSKPEHELYVHMFRQVFLRTTMLGVLVYFWFEVAADKLPCWETFVGQEIYRLVIVDLIFTLGYTFFMEFVRKLLSLKIKSVERAEFAIGRHTLSLVYSQCLCWLGIFYSPLLSVVVILKLIIIFYVKRFSVVQNCRPSIKPWRASRTHTIFIGYLFVLFIFTCVAVGCGIVLIRPSRVCGPYKQYDTSYQVVENLVDEWKSDHNILKEIFQFINSPGFIAGLLIFLCVILYYTRAVMVGHRRMAAQLRTQLASEGKDKKFLMNLLNQVRIKGRRVSHHPGPKLTSKVDSMSVSPSTASGKVFVRTVAEGML